MKDYATFQMHKLIADSYQDGAGNTVPSDWEKWNADSRAGLWIQMRTPMGRVKGGKE